MAAALSEEEIERRFEEAWQRGTKARTPTTAPTRRRGASGPERAFDEACARGHLDRVWQLWSDAAEDPLAEPAARGHRRSEALRPRETAQACHRQVVVESLRIRQLLRVKRRIDEWKRSRDEGLKGRIAASAATMARTFPLLAKARNIWEMQDAVTTSLAKEEKRDRDVLVAKWQERTHADVRVKREWVMRQQTEPLVRAHSEVHPAHVASNLAAGQLRELWTAPARDEIDCEDFSWAEGVGRWIDSKHEPLLLAEFIGGRSTAPFARRPGRRRAPMGGAPPTWRAYRRSPCGPPLARLWDALREGRTPTAWGQCCVVGVPKTEGGVRPMSVMAAAWRGGHDRHMPARHVGHAMVPRRDLRRGRRPLIRHSA